MKRLFGILSVALALLAMVSCQTYNEAALQAVRSVAVVAIQFNRSVDMSAFTHYAATARGWAKSAAFDLSPAAARIDSAVFSAWSRSFSFAFVPERQVLDTPEYQALLTDGTKLFDGQAVTVPEGYVAIPADAASAKVLAGRFPEADAFLWAETTYTLLKKDEFKGTEFARMRADLTVTVFDRGGRAVLRHTVAAEDSSDIRIITIGVIPASDFAAAAVRATAAASVEMARWLEGKTGR
jgi:hypothetical protein